jgi:DNA processing protein
MSVQTISFNNPTKYISPFLEMAAYETLWSRHNASFKKISDLFKKYPGSKPSELVDDLEKMALLMEKLKEYLQKEVPYKPNILINGTFDYPAKLRDAKDPIEVLYYSGNLDHLFTKSVAIVGTRKASEEGIKRAAKLTKILVSDGFTIVSGLAEGIDTAAHKTALENKGKTIAVIGTPLNEYYPKQNSELQNQIANEQLLVSQVPFHRYSEQTWKGNRLFFPERNKTMSALTAATIIVEASDTSGTLIQATAAIDQGRKLFILDSCFDKGLKWPEKFVSLGAIRVKEYEDIKNNLS